MEDVAEEKAHKYGSSFLSCIEEFCRENDWSTDKKQQQSEEQSSVVEVAMDDVSTILCGSVEVAMDDVSTILYS